MRTGATACDALQWTRFALPVAYTVFSSAGQRLSSRLRVGARTPQQPRGHGFNSRQAGPPQTRIRQEPTAGTVLPRELLVPSRATRSRHKGVAPTGWTVYILESQTRPGERYIGLASGEPACEASRWERAGERRDRRVNGSSKPRWRPKLFSLGSARLRRPREPAEFRNRY